MDDACYDDNGTQKLVNADRFTEKNAEIRKDAFYCPECGEPVILASTKEKNRQRPHFRHCHCDEYTEACDRRMKGVSKTDSYANMFYQYVGLPLYLRRTDLRTFDLKIGFRPLDAALFQQAEEQKASVIIRGENNKTIRFQINRQRFHHDQSSYHTVRDITIPTTHYRLSYDIADVFLQKKLEEWWNDTAEGFCDTQGMLFHREQGGRKVKRGGNAVLDGSYDLLWKSSGGITIPICLQPFFKLVGNLGTRPSYPIYQMKIPSSVLDSDYRSACDFIWEHLKIHLLRSAPKIVPLWPPSIQSVDILHVLPLPKENSLNDVWISIANHTTKIYWHADHKDGHSCVDVQPRCHDASNGSSLYKIPMPKEVKPRLVTVDKRPMSERCLLEWHMPEYTGFQEKIEIAEFIEKNSVAIPITPDGITISSQEATLMVSIPFHASVVHHSADCDIIYKKRSSRPFKLKKCHPGDLLIICNAWREILRIPIRQPQMSHVNEGERLRRLLQGPLTGPDIPIPGWACELIRKYLSNTSLFLQIRSFWIRGVLPASVLMALKKFKSEGENQ